MHVFAEFKGLRGIYDNHAGCERGYFRKPDNDVIVLPKRDSNGMELALPDLVLHDPSDKTILIIEGKKHNKLADGLNALEQYGPIENEYICPHYPSCKVERWVTLYGGNLNTVPEEKVLLLVNKKGNLILNDNAPNCIKRIFEI